MSAARRLQGFRDWLLERGRADNTADAYVGNVKLALESAKITQRLVGPLAPKSKRVVLASLRAYAHYTGDHKLTAKLKDIKLPAAVRKSVRRPLEFDDWRRLCVAADASELPAAKRAVVGLMANRGFRCGDVLRMQRDQMVEALRTGELVFESKGGHWLRYLVTDSVRPHLEALVALGTWTEVVELVSRAKKRRHNNARKTCNRALRRIAATVGIPAEEVYSHRLRRTYSVYFLRELQGDSEAMQKLQAQMQWASPMTAFEYTDYVNKVELDTFDAKLARKRKARP